MDTVRSQIIRLAHERPDLRPHLLPVLTDGTRLAMEFPNEEALKKYLKDHPNADASKHTVGKPKEDDGEGGSKGKGKHREKALEGMPANQIRMIEDMPTENLDKHEAYRHPKIKALSKEFQKLPLRTVQKLYHDLPEKQSEIVRSYLGEEDAEKVEELRTLARQINSVWRAANDALFTMQEESRRLENEPTAKHRYLPRAEMKKRSEIPHDFRSKLEDWMAPKGADPIRRVVDEMRANGGWVPHAKVDKALKHLETLADDPHHADDKREILKLRDDLAKATGRKKTASDLRAQLIRLAAARKELRPHLLLLLQASSQ